MVLTRHVKWRRVCAAVVPYAFEGSSHAHTDGFFAEARIAHRACAALLHCNVVCARHVHVSYQDVCSIWNKFAVELTVAGSHGVIESE